MKNTKNLTTGVTIISSLKNGKETFEVSSIYDGNVTSNPLPKLNAHQRVILSKVKSTFQRNAVFMASTNETVIN